MSALCPTCGRPMEAHRAPLESLAGAPLGYTGRAIVNVLVRAYPQSVSRPDMVEAVYGAADHGSPNAITVAVGHLRPVIESFGWTVRRSKSGTAANGYRLEPVSQEKKR